MVSGWFEWKRDRHSSSNKIACGTSKSKSNAICVSPFSVSFDSLGTLCNAQGLFSLHFGFGAMWPKNANQKKTKKVVAAAAWSLAFVNFTEVDFLKVAIFCVCFSHTTAQRTFDALPKWFRRDAIFGIQNRDEMKSSVARECLDARLNRNSIRRRYRSETWRPNCHLSIVAHEF